MIQGKTKYLVSTALCVLLSRAACFATTYYVDASAGKDTNTGKSTTAPWKTLAKVNSYTGFAAGDHILLKRGQTWREQLTVPRSGVSGSPMVFGTYGTGSKPMLKGSARVANWTGAGTYKWRAALSSAPNQVFFNGVRGTRKSGTSALTAARTWYWASGVLYVYSTSDPDSAFVSPGIEASIRPSTRSYGIIHMAGRQYVTVQDIDVSQSASYGIYIRPTSRYITVQGCDVGYSLDGGIVASTGATPSTQISVINCSVHHNNTGFIGGGVPGVATYHEGLTMEGINGFLVRGTKVYANYMEGSNFKRGARNGVIENCLLYANGLINQYIEGATNIQIRYNKIYDCTYNAGIEFGLETNTYSNDTIKIYDNLFWGNSGGISFWSSSVTAQTKNISIYNNTFFNNWEAIRWKSGATDNYSGTNTIKNNLIWQNSTSNWGIHDYTTNRQAISRTAIAYNTFQQGAATNTTGTYAKVVSNPYFVNAGSRDFHLRSSSPCINVAASVGLTRDFDGTAVPQGSRPDMGAYEYKSSTTTTASYAAAEVASDETMTADSAMAADSLLREILSTGDTLVGVVTPKGKGNVPQTKGPSKGAQEARMPKAAEPATDDQEQTSPTIGGGSLAGGSVVTPSEMMLLHVRNAGKGVNPASVTIEVDGNIVYSGDVESARTAYGVCARTGIKADYTYLYQPRQSTGQQVVVAINARDLVGNVLPEQTYLFDAATPVPEVPQSVAPEQAGVDQNGLSDQLALDPNTFGQRRPAPVSDGQGNTWSIWQAGEAGQRQIYISRASNGVETSEDTVQLTRGQGDHTNPAVAVDGAGVLYAVWQENVRGNWDVCLSVSADGKAWSAPKAMIDANDNQVNPAIAASGQPNGLVAVLWQDDRSGNQDVYMATSTDAFTSSTVTAVASDEADQTDPAVFIDGEDAIFMRWMDTRNDVTAPLESAQEP